MKILEPFVRRLYPKVSRSIVEFAEQEVILPVGPRKGMYFDWDYAPFNKFIAEAIMEPYWRKVSVVGPTQNGKTLVATNIPLLYYLFEEEEDVIFGVPSMDLAYGLWNEKIKPVIVDCPKYRELLPTKGAGSRGGNFTAVQFKNGVTLRFMGAGGSPEQMSSHTAKYVILTEVDKMDQATGDRTEADPVSLIQMRADAFEESKIVMECTVTTQDGRIWQEAMIQGSGGIIHVPCRFCGKYQPLVRDQLRFDATSQVSAEESARYECAHCGALWTNNDRLEALDNPLLVHRGQEIGEDGVISGELPPTKSFGLHYNVLYSPLQSLAKTSGQQWEADTSELKEKKKAMVQSKWAVPWVDDDVLRDQLTPALLRKLSCASGYRLREIPDWVEKLTFAVDIQKTHCYWQCEGYNMTTMRSVVIEYGTVDKRENTEVGLHNMLNDVDEICREGWVQFASGTTLHPSIRMVDCGYDYHEIERWLVSHRDWIGVKGIGQGQRTRLTGAKEVFKIDGVLTVRQQDSGTQLWFIEVDNTKSMVHDRYLLPSPEIDFFRFVPEDVDISWIKSMTAERREYDALGDGFKWKKVHRRNDYLDVSSYNVAGSYILRHKHKRDVEREKKQVTENYTRLKTENNPPRRQQSNRGGFFSGERSGLWGG